MCFGARGERAGQSINALNTRFHEYIHNQVRHFFLPLFGSSLPTGSKVEIARTSLPSEMGTVSDGPSRFACKCEWSLRSCYVCS
jgi:hypothetical protein